MWLLSNECKNECASVLHMPIDHLSKQGMGVGLHKLSPDNHSSLRVPSGTDF